MNTPGKLLNRIRQTFGFLISGGDRNGREVDGLVKMNLSPRLGRRDAAYLRVDELWQGDLFALERDARIALYNGSVTLLELAGFDTSEVLVTLSSPDTESRERRFLGYLQLLREMIAGLSALVTLEKSLTATDAERSFVSADSMDDFVREERTVNDSELLLAGRVRDLMERSRDRINRYREYTLKSFSKSNAARYRKALDEYLKLYRES